MTQADTATKTIRRIARELRAAADNLSPIHRGYPANAMLRWADQLEATLNGELAQNPKGE